VGKLHVPLNEAGIWYYGLRIDDALAKKGELVTKFQALLRPNIAGEIPPLRLEIRMAPVILREFVIPTREGCLPLRVGHGNARQKNEKKYFLMPKKVIPESLKCRGSRGEFISATIQSRFMGGPNGPSFSILTKHERGG